MYGNQEIPFNVYEDYEDASPLPIQIQAVELLTSQ